MYGRRIPEARMNVIVTPEYDRLTTMPPEIGLMICEQLDGIDLKNFRLASKTTAALGYDYLGDWVANHLETKAYNHRNTDQFFNDLYYHMPSDAANVTELTVFNKHRPMELLATPAIGLVRFPSLEKLTLRDVVIDYRTFLKFLDNHRHTLKHLTLDNVAIAIDRMDRMKVYRRWHGLSRYIKDHIKRLTSIKLQLLGGYDIKTGECSSKNIELPQAKYHYRHLDKSQRHFWKLHNGGVEARGKQAVRLGVKAFIKEMARQSSRV
jgi:hypothetical protein